MYAPNNMTKPPQPAQLFDEEEECSSQDDKEVEESTFDKKPEAKLTHVETAAEDTEDEIEEDEDEDKEEKTSFMKSFTRQQNIPTII